MRVPDEALKLIDAVVAATSLPVTLKMRLGWDDDSLNAAQLARRAVDAGVRMITVHGRTRQQFYKGEARWNLVRPVVEAVPVPVVVNGDVIDLAAAREALRVSGAAAVMIGRGAQGQPWVVGQIGAALQGSAPSAAPAGDALVALVAEHYEAMLDEYGVQVGVRAARKHLDWYLQARGGAIDPVQRKCLLNADEPATVLAMLPAMYGDEQRAAA
jgi:tRNA-dihydrouridine synthase B